MGNVLLFILAFGAIPFLFFVSSQLFGRLLDHFSSDAGGEVDEDKEAAITNHSSQV